MRLFAWTLRLTFALLPNWAAATIITFETTPSGETPVDDSELQEAYKIEGGSVRFFFDEEPHDLEFGDGDLFPRFERSGGQGDTGPTNRGFANSTNSSSLLHDTARPGFEQQLGEYFLRYPAELSRGPMTLVVQLESTADWMHVSGELWDIDGNAPGGQEEQWQLSVFSSGGEIMQTLLSPRGIDESLASYDGLPWTFDFWNVPGNASLQLKYIGKGQNRRNNGVGFNNFAFSVQQGLVGDFNGDGAVDALDLAKWKTDFGRNSDSDADGDGDSDGRDFLIWQRYVGTMEVVPTLAVPEPNAFTLGGVAVIVLLLQTKRPMRYVPCAPR